MKVIFKPKFKRDVDKISSRELLVVLKEKILKIKNADSLDSITGLKLLRGYSHHYRIIIKTGDFSYRIGAMIRGNKIWLIRFLPRSIVYKQFP